MKKSTVRIYDTISKEYVDSKRQPNPAPPKNKMSRDQPRLKSCIRFITMNYCELL